MALDDTDRRRFFIAALVSMLALPALWWVNRDDPTNRPNTASVGVDIDSSSPDASSPPDTVATIESTIGESNLPTEPTILDRPPVFLDGPASVGGGVLEIAVPNPDALETIITSATYGTFAGSDTCIAKSITTGQVITVINLDNNRSISCRVSFAPATQQADLILQTTQFTELADLTDAPIPVQIRL